MRSLYLVTHQYRVRVRVKVRVRTLTLTLTRIGGDQLWDVIVRAVVERVSCVDCEECGWVYEMNPHSLGQAEVICGIIGLGLG